MQGKLIAITGPMFSGKTSYLIEIYYREKDVVVFKPDLDKRYTKQPLVVSHNQDAIPSVLVNNDRPEEMLELVRPAKVVLIDEVNFFSERVTTVIKEMLEHKISVYAAGLNKYADGDPWGPMDELARVAHEVVELTARCDGEEGKCPNKATRSYRKASNMEKVQVAGADQYGAACEKHYKKLHHQVKQP